MTAVAGPTALATDWVHCGHCNTLLYGKRMMRSLGVCPDCGGHSRLTAHERVEQLLDRGTAEEVAVALPADDPLAFTGREAYAQRLHGVRVDTRMECGVVVARGAVEGIPLVLAVMDFRFFGGSLGGAEGEAITVAAETALHEGLPLVVVTSSGGARMQEGAVALMQMAKTSNAFAALDEAGLLTVTVVADPTFGGVAASFATLSDVVIAEPGARMGFAGPRVIEQTIRQQLPPGFQTAEHLLAHGLVDMVVPRVELRTVLGRLLVLAPAPPPFGWGAETLDPSVRDPGALPVRDSWDIVAAARHIDRPTGRDHVAHLIDGFVELRGDRAGEDCPALAGGVGLLDGLPVVVVFHQKGHTTAELVARNFAMPSPAGYRKAGRLMRLAEKVGAPVLTLVDTPGAFPGITAEERGQSSAIAENLRLMGGLRVPVVAVITGEGGSGGALALGVADVVLMTVNGIYSVISPEGCASILWRDPGSARAAAAALRLDARSLLELGVIDAVVPEPEGGSQHDLGAASSLVLDAVVAAIRDELDRPPQERVTRRRARFRRFGSISQKEV